MSAFCIDNWRVICNRCLRVASIGFTVFVRLWNNTTTVSHVISWTNTHNTCWNLGHFDLDKTSLILFNPRPCTRIRNILCKCPVKGITPRVLFVTMRFRETFAVYTYNIKCNVIVRKPSSQNLRWFFSWICVRENVFQKHVRFCSKYPL